MFYKKETSEDWFRHSNPDGSLGGVVSKNANIGKMVHIEKTALVIGKAIVPDNTIVEKGQIFSEEGPFHFTKS